MTKAVRLKPCKQSHTPETAELRRLRLDARRQRQDLRTSDMIVLTTKDYRAERAEIRRAHAQLVRAMQDSLKAGQIPPLHYPGNRFVVGKYLPHQGKRECARRARG